jgi:MSHA pilin protein MshC
MNRVRGFSLIELVVVMVIAAILAAIAVPRLTDTESKASWFYEEVKAGVRYAQRQAVAQRRCVFVSVTAAQVSLFYGDAGCAVPATPLTQIATGASYVLAAPPGVAMSILPAVPVSFNGLGQPSTGAALSVGAKTITINAETGYVQ